jgi:hypothetical protein
MKHLVMLVLLALAQPAAADVPHVRCGTPRLLATQRIPKLATRSPRTRLLDGPKQVQDTFGEAYQILESTNFAVKWLDLSIQPDLAQLAVDALEQSWTKYIDEFGHAPCETCDEFKINAYITGAMETPAIDYAGGYAWVDQGGNPYFVISKDLFASVDSAETIASVAAHEFYHDVQFASGAFTFETTPYGWFWEATAEWAAQHVLPDAADPFVFSGAFALRSELPLYFYGDPFGENQVEGVHQYGAAIFWRFVTDKLGSPAAIVDTWEEAGADAEPMNEVEARLPSGDLAALHTEFAARNVLWDYPYRDFILASIANYQAFSPELDLISLRVPANGTPRAPLPRPPYGFGYTTIEIARPDLGQMTVEVSTIVNANVALHGTVVFDQPGGPTYLPLPVDAATATGRLTIDFPAGVERAYLVVSITTPTRITSSPFAVQFAATPGVPEDESEPDGGEGGGCCQTARGGEASALGLAGIVAILLGRRRRRVGT